MFLFFYENFQWTNKIKRKIKKKNYFFFFFLDKKTIKYLNFWTLYKYLYDGLFSLNTQNKYKKKISHLENSFFLNYGTSFSFDSPYSFVISRVESEPKLWKELLSFWSRNIIQNCPMTSTLTNESWAMFPSPPPKESETR